MAFMKTIVFCFVIGFAWSHRHHELFERTDFERSNDHVARRFGLDGKKFKEAVDLGEKNRRSLNIEEPKGSDIPFSARRLEKMLEKAILKIITGDLSTADMLLLKSLNYSLEEVLEIREQELSRRKEEETRRLEKLKQEKKNHHDGKKPKHWTQSPEFYSSQGHIENPKKEHNPKATYSDFDFESYNRQAVIDYENLASSVDIQQSHVDHSLDYEEKVQSKESEEVESVESIRRNFDRAMEPHVVFKIRYDDSEFDSSSDEKSRGKNQLSTRSPKHHGSSTLRHSATTSGDTRKSFHASSSSSSASSSFPSSSSRTPSRHTPLPIVYQLNSIKGLNLDRSTTRGKSSSFHEKGSHEVDPRRAESKEVKSHRLESQETKQHKESRRHEELEVDSHKGSHRLEPRKLDSRRVEPHIIDPYNVESYKVGSSEKDPQTIESQKSELNSSGSLENLQTSTTDRALSIDANDSSTASMKKMGLGSSEENKVDESGGRRISEYEGLEWVEDDVYRVIPGVADSLSYDNNDENETSDYEDSDSYDRRVYERMQNGNEAYEYQNDTPDPVKLFMANASYSTENMTLANLSTYQQLAIAHRRDQGQKAIEDIKSRVLALTGRFNLSANMNQVQRERLTMFPPTCQVPRNSDPEAWADPFSMNMHFHLNLSSGDHVVAAKLRIYKLPQENLTSSGSGTFEDEEEDEKKIRISIYYYTKSLKKHRSKKRLMDSVVTPLTSDGTHLALDARQGLRFWRLGTRNQHGNASNHGLVVQVEDQDGRPLKPALYIQQPSCSDRDSDQKAYQRVPALFVRACARYVRIVNGETVTYVNCRH